MATPDSTDSLHFAAEPVRAWFQAAFAAPTAAQVKAWPAISRGESTLLLAPTGSGKTLAAFLVALNRVMFGGVAPEAAPRASAKNPEPGPARGRSSRRPPPLTRVLYVSPMKALGVDVERNLRAPLIGISQAAERAGVPFVPPTVGVRSGDTPALERRRMLREPPAILITTPESLYLMLTSEARHSLAGVETVIIDEVHAVCNTKRGSHLFLSLERLEELRGQAPALQRIGLSATQRPLEEIARLLGGYRPLEGNQRVEDAQLEPRPVTVIDAGSTKTFELQVVLPAQEQAQLGDEPSLLDDEPKVKSIWPSIYPRLLKLIEQHRTTMIFTNSRLLAERIAKDLNELANRQVALAHHGSIAKEMRSDIEERLKRGELPAIVATSSLELGIDMGSVDLVVQIEAPLSIASGIQRIGRAGHQSGAASRGVLIPKYRGDLLACAAASRHIIAGHVEASSYPRNPLDVLAQQLVAMLAVAPAQIDELFALVTRAAPFAELPRQAFEGVLDMLSGRFPSDRFAELRPRINWDRSSGRLEARRGAQMLAVVNGGTIADRGLYAVYFRDGERQVRVGELDEEMVFESRPGDVITLGVSSWRVEDITHDRVLVTPAPGQPGRMPFWHGDRPARPAEFGVEIGALARELLDKPDHALALLETDHCLEADSAKNLLEYVQEQAECSFVPTDRRVVVECFLDEVGDWRVAVLSSFGGRVHAPWATAIVARLRDRFGADVDSMWTDDGMVFRLPEADAAPELDWFLPGPDEAKQLVTAGLSATSLFASYFRESAARALLLPRRKPGRRMPLWVQRRRSADLLSVAADYPDFPIVLEVHRECLSDVFDLPALTDLLSGIQAGRIRAEYVRTRLPSPFAASLMFSYVGNFIYDTDAPLAERRAQILSLDHGQLAQLMGEQELRQLLSVEAIGKVSREVGGYTARLRDADDLRDWILDLGDVGEMEIQQRFEELAEGRASTAPGPSKTELLALWSSWLEELLHAKRVLRVRVAAAERIVAVEDAARYRDALGVVLPSGIPREFLTPVADAWGDLVSRFARTRGPFRIQDLADRYAVSEARCRSALEQLAALGRVLRGAFLPDGSTEEWVHRDVLRRIRSLSLAELRSQVAPVEAAQYASFLVRYHHLETASSSPAEAHRLGAGSDAVFSCVEQLQGIELPIADLESELLAARVPDYHGRDLDELCAAGEVLWKVVAAGSPSEPESRESSSYRAGAAPSLSQWLPRARIALFLSSDFAQLAGPAQQLSSPRHAAIRTALAERGAMFFEDLRRALGGFEGELFEALWDLVWSGEVTNDTLAPLRSLLASQVGRHHKGGRPARRGFRSRRQFKPGTEGRWSLLPQVASDPNQRALAMLEQLKRRYGVITREAVKASGYAGGFSRLYPLLKTLEESGKLRRGYFIAGLGGAQFAAAGIETELRRDASELSGGSWLRLAATDPANPYGSVLPWPEHATARPARAAQTSVVFQGGELRAYLSAGWKLMFSYLPDEDPARASVLRELCTFLTAEHDRSGPRVWQLAEIDAEPAAASAFAEAFRQRGFSPAERGLVRRRGAI